MDEEACGDRQIRARERTADTAANQTVRAIRAKDPRRPGRLTLRRDAPSVALPRKIAHASSAERCTGTDCGRKQRAVEYGARGNGKRGCPTDPVTKYYASPATPIFERDVTDRHRL